MAATGYLYVPADCRKAAANCAVHVVFHGCLQSAAKEQDKVYGKVGYNEWADRNRIIILYPQVDPSDGPDFFHQNPNGCWDWWGYSVPFFSIQYLLKTAPQLATIHRMVAQLTNKP